MWMSQVSSKSLNDKHNLLLKGKEAEAIKEAAVTVVTA
jgi:hypothetical protein